MDCHFHQPSTLQQVCPTRHPNVSIEPVTPQTLSSYRRLLTLLLPIRYPDNFYEQSIAAVPERSSISLIAIWHETPPTSTSNPSTSKVVGGIQARLEPLSISISPTASTQTQTLYIQTLALLAPYRQLGIASSLLSELITRSLRQHPALRIESIYAHVWEASDDALEWYGKRGFVIEKAVIPQYYRRLKPGGARVVRKKIVITDYLREGGEDLRNMGGSEGLI